MRNAVQVYVTALCSALSTKSGIFSGGKLKIDHVNILVLNTKVHDQNVEPGPNLLV